MEFVSIPAGVLLMGSTMAEVDACVTEWKSRLLDPSYTADAFREFILKEFPRHEVALSAFCIGKYPVTNADYRAFLNAEAGTSPESLAIEEPGDHPVWGVGLRDAERYASWLGTQLKRPCRLPTEAEWEYSARGRTAYEYPYGNIFDATKANTSEAGIGHTTPVDKYARFASPFGVCDLAGNVEEWTTDVYQPYPGGRYIRDDIERLCGPGYNVLRGGSFARGGDLARCARRHGPYPAPEFRYIGFRVVIGEARA